MKTQSKQFIDRELTEALAIAALNLAEDHIIPCNSLEKLLDYLTDIYMPGAVCDFLRREHDYLGYTPHRPMPWPLPNVRFMVKRWDVEPDDIEVYDTIFVEQNLSRWGYHSEAEKGLLVPPYSEAWEDFEIVKAFRIGQLKIVEKGES